MSLKNGYHKLAIVLFGTALFLPGALSADFNPTFGMGASQPDSSGFGVMQHGEPEKKKPKFASTAFARYRMKFASLCLSAGRDGRQAELLNMLDLNSYADENCPACRPLLRTFALGCQAKARKKKGAEDATPVPPPVKQREPGFEVLKITSDTFKSIQEGTKENAMEEVLKGMDRLLLVLRAGEGKTAAGAEYFRVLAAYMEAPFARNLKERTRASSMEQEPPTMERKKQALDDLFGS